MSVRLSEKVSTSGAADLGSSPASALGLLPGRVIQECKKSQIAPFNAIMMMMMMMMMMINRIERRNSRFFTISSLRRELSPTRTLKWPGRDRVQIMCNTSSAYHVQHAVRHLMRRVSSAIQFDRVEIAIFLDLSLLAETINR